MIFVCWTVNVPGFNFRNLVTLFNVGVDFHSCPIPLLCFSWPATNQRLSPREQTDRREKNGYKKTTEWLALSSKSSLYIKVSYCYYDSWSSPLQETYTTWQDKLKAVFKGPFTQWQYLHNEVNFCCSVVFGLHNNSADLKTQTFKTGFQSVICRKRHPNLDLSHH